MGNDENGLGNAWVRLPTGDKAGNLMKAIAMYEAALSVSTKDANPVEWATMQNNLGTAWNVLPTGHKTENLKKAIMAYKAALSVRPDALYPVLRRSIESSLSWNELLTKDFVGACRRVSRRRTRMPATSLYKPSAHTHSCF